MNIGKGFPVGDITAEGIASYQVIKAPPFFQLEHHDLKDGGFSLFAPVRGYLGGDGITITGGHAKGLLPAGTFRGDGGGAILEKSYEISFDMVVLHELSPGFDEGGSFMGDMMYNFEDLASKTTSAYGYTPDYNALAQSTINEAKNKTG